MTVTRFNPTSWEGDWTDIANAQYDDGSVAGGVFGRNTVFTGEWGGYNFSGTIPEGATINSVTVGVNCATVVVGGMDSWLLQCEKNGSLSGTALTSAFASDTDTSTGGGTWTAAELRGSATLTVYVVCDNGNNPTTRVDLDHVWVEVDWTAGTTNYKTVSTTVGLAEGLVRKAKKVSTDGVATSATLGRKARKFLTITAATLAALLKYTKTTRAVTVGVSASLTPSRIFLRVVSAAAATSASCLHKVTLTRLATVGSSASLTRRLTLYLLLAATVGLAPSLTPIKQGAAALSWMQTHLRRISLPHRPNGW